MAFAPGMGFGMPGIHVGGSGRGAATPGTAPTGNPADFMRLLQQGQSQVDLANALAQMSPGGQSRGWGDVIATLLGGYQSAKKRKSGEESIAKAIEQEMAYKERMAAEERAREQAEQARRAAAEESRWQRRFDAQNNEYDRRQANQPQAQPSPSALQQKVALIQSMGLTPEQEQQAIQQIAGVDLGAGQQQSSALNAFPKIAAAVEAGVLDEQGAQQAIAREVGLAPKESAQDARLERARSNVIESAQRYRAMLEETGTEYAGDKASALKTAYVDLQMKAKNAEELGALAGPDLDLLNDLLGGDPTSLRAQFNPLGASKRIAAIDQYLVGKGAGSGQQSSQPAREAPEFAVQALLSDPSEKKKQDFFEYYGYLPDGI